jgi:hypothetical protein
VVVDFGAEISLFRSEGRKASLLSTIRLSYISRPAGTAHLQSVTQQVRTAFRTTKTPHVKATLKTITVHDA